MCSQNPASTTDLAKVKAILQDDNFGLTDEQICENLTSFLNYIDCPQALRHFAQYLAEVINRYEY